ncbi:MAG: DUF4124 domain-containing protein [Rhodocyclaceae bacterium]
MMKLRILPCSIPSLLLAIFASSARADIYKCTDAEGHVTYSNVATAKCKKLNLDPVNTAPPPRETARDAVKSPTPATFPKVDDSTQKARDTDRRRILESELTTEQKNLEQAKKELAEQEAVRGGDEKNYQRVLDRLQPFKDRVALHERNLEAIRKEIANLR